MALVPLKPLLDEALAKRYAIGSFNIVGMEGLEGILEAAERVASPVILSIAEVHFPYITIENIAPAIRAVAERASVPVVLHLDHGESVEAIMRALRAGFTSIMFDGSALPFSENVAKTRDIVRMCHMLGVSVEAELGHIGGGEGYGGESDSPTGEDALTKPDEAERFVAETGIDCLAVGIGTVHGHYRGTPTLDLARLEEIHRRVPVPLVLHGGSGLSQDEFRSCIDRGVGKINFFTGMATAACNAIRDILPNDPKFSDYPGVLRAAKQAITEIVANQMRVFRSAAACETKRSLCENCTGCSIKSGGVRHRAPADASGDVDRTLVAEITDAVMRAVEGRA